MNAPTVLVLCASRLGHARRVAEQILAAGGGCAAEWQDLLAGPPQPTRPLAEYERILVVASVRYGRFPLSLQRFVLLHHAELTAANAALVGVCLVARKPGKQDAAGNAYLRHLLQRTGWQPRHCIAVAGELRMPAYALWQRYMLQLIMRLTGSPVSRDTVHDYTDWPALSRWASAYWQQA
ncbi:flavodoxin domain-containing protein [Chitinilyticum piscinae]|uniref:Flavodoxin domain-containing protein n=1 Tax=Chitinilyticum piscinae TaxID=2866724 RepID=A0A8J7FQY1_9NEIS|nr:flavodoxin domain-containing protein [Chitinilyticum piscinae]MBE9609126.1 hypothetical protein [Chitinilyticum piscinae]